MSELTPGDLDNLTVPKASPEDLMARQRMVEAPELFKILPKLSKKQLVRVLQQITCGGFEIANEEAKETLEKNALALAEHLATTRILLVIHSTQQHLWNDNVSAQSTDGNQERRNENSNQNTNLN